MYASQQSSFIYPDCERRVDRGTVPDEPRCVYRPAMLPNIRLV